MTLAAQLLKTQQASLEVAVERAAPKGWKAGRTTVDGQTTQTSKAYAAEENPEHRQLLLDNGWDPERHKIVGPIRQSTWTAYLPKEYRSNSEEGAPVEDAFTFQAKAYRFNVVERGEGELSIDELVEVVNKYPAAFKPRAMMGVGEPEASFPTAQTSGQSTAGGGGIGSFAPSASSVLQAPQQCDTVSLFRPDLPYVVALGDTQIGKLENPTEELLQRVMDLMQKAVQPLELHKVSTGTLAKHAHLPWLGDCIEGMNSQGGRLRWRTTLTVTEQVRILRRLMLYQVELVAPLAERVTMVSVPGNHDEANTRDMDTRVDDSWAVEALNQVADALSYNEAAFGHVECYVPGPDEHAVVMDVGGTIVAHTHGHEHAHNKHFQYWSGQALGEQPMGRAQVWLQGHGHHLQYDESGHRKWLEVPALESKSVWWERKTGTSGSPGLVTFQLDDGELLNLSKLQPKKEATS